MKKYIRHISSFPLSKSHAFIFACLSLAAFMLLTACRNNRFKLIFNLSEDTNDAYTLSMYASDEKRGFFVETGVSVQKGKGEISLPAVNPAIITLTAGARNLYIYMERGDEITIEGAGNAPLSWEIGGNKINNELTDWRLKNEKALASGQPEAINDAVAKYVRENPANPVATLLLELYYNRRADNLGFLSLWKLLKEEAASEKWISIVSRNDLYTNTPLPAPDFSKSMTFVLKSLGNGADTIRTGEVPVVLYFWRIKDTDRNKSIDSLRKLRKENPDSAKFIIADICFESDSVNWRMPLGRDSLEHTIRAWAPLAEADSLMKALGVERTPLMLRIDPVKKKTAKKKTATDSIPDKK